MRNFKHHRQKRNFSFTQWMDKTALKIIVDIAALKKIGIKDVLFKPKDLPRLTEVLAALQQTS